MLFQCRTRLCGGCNTMVLFARMCVRGFNAARGFVGGAAIGGFKSLKDLKKFQCRTRLCGWCNKNSESHNQQSFGFNAARGFVGGAT